MRRTSRCLHGSFAGLRLLALGVAGVVAAVAAASATAHVGAAGRCAIPAVHRVPKSDGGFSSHRWRVVQRDRQAVVIGLFAGKVAIRRPGSFRYCELSTGGFHSVQLPNGERGECPLFISGGKPGVQLKGIYVAYETEAAAGCGRYGDELARLSVLNVRTRHATTGTAGDASCSMPGPIVATSAGVAAGAVCGSHGWTLLITDPRGSSAVDGPAAASLTDPFAPYSIYECSAASTGCSSTDAIVSWISDGQREYRPAP